MPAKPVGLFSKVTFRRTDNEITEENQDGGHNQGQDR